MESFANTNSSAPSSGGAPGTPNFADEGGRRTPSPAADHGDWLRRAADPQCADQPDSLGTVYGYARVSSRDQNLSRQMDAFAEFGVERGNIFAEKASGKDFERPRYKALLRRLRPGDVVVVKSIDRLGRNYEEILEEWRRITRKRKAAIVVLDMPLLDTRVTKGNLTGVFIADVMLQLLSYVAQVERENTRQRQAEGIAAAKARGVRFGRPCLARPEGYPEVRRANLSGELTRMQAAKALGVSRSTFDKWVREDSRKVGKV